MLKREVADWIVKEKRKTSGNKREKNVFSHIIRIFSNDIRLTGHAAIYGIYFDTGKSVIKSESTQAIGEIAKILKSDPALNLFVIGHTDNEGGIDSNIKLSQSCRRSDPGAHPRPQHRPCTPESLWMRSVCTRCYQ